MDNWQQRAEREDPFPDIPFGDTSKWDTDSLVGLVCIVAALIAIFC